MTRLYENSKKTPFWAIITHFRANMNFTGKSNSAFFVSKFLSLCKISKQLINRFRKKLTTDIRTYQQAWIHRISHAWVPIMNKFWEKLVKDVWVYVRRDKHEFGGPPLQGYKSHRIVWGDTQACHFEVIFCPMALSKRMISKNTLKVHRKK